MGLHAALDFRGEARAVEEPERGERGERRGQRELQTHQLFAHRAAFLTQLGELVEAEGCVEGGLVGRRLREWVELGRVTRTVFQPHPEVVQSLQDGVGPTAGTKLGPSRDQAQLLDFARESRTAAELMSQLARHNRTKFREQFIRPLLDKGWLALTIPDKPNHPRQRYAPTAAGLQALAAARLRWG